MVTAHPKYFELDMNGKIYRVSINRLKRAYVENHCFGPDRSIDSSEIESRDKHKKPLEIKEKAMQPLT